MQQSRNQISELLGKVDAVLNLEVETTHPRQWETLLAQVINCKASSKELYNTINDYLKEVRAFQRFANK